MEQYSKLFRTFVARILIDTLMSYTEIVQLELLNALNSITSEAELNEYEEILAGPSCPICSNLPL